MLRLGQLAAACLAALALALAPPARAVDTLFTQFAAASTNGNTTFAASIGNTFTVVSPIQVTSIGGLVSADGTWTSNKIFHISTTASGNADVVGPVTITPADLSGGVTFAKNFALKSITPVTLGPGTYKVWEEGYGSDKWYNNGAGGSLPVGNTGGGLISFGSVSADSGSVGSYPTSPSGGDAFAFTAANFTFRAPVTLSFSIAPNTGPTGSPLTVTATGTGTAWTSGTTFAVAGGVGASISATSVNASTQVATFTLNPGSSAATLTISDSTDSATASFSATTPATTVFPDDAKLLYSPFNWNVGHSQAVTNSPGAYFSILVTSTGCKLNFNTANAGIANPRIKYKVDNGAWQAAAVSAQVDVTGGTPLSALEHLVEVAFYQCDTAQNRWAGSPAAAVYLTSITLDAGATYRAPTPAPRKVLVYADSIGEGWNCRDGSVPASSDGTASFAFCLRELLGCEVGVAAYAQQGVTVGGGGGVPALTSSYPLIYQGVSRSFAGCDLVIIAHGTNDSANMAAGSAVTAGLEAVVAGLVAAGIPTTKVLLTVSPGGWMGAAISAAATASGTRFADATGVVDAGGFTDSLHPTAAAHRAEYAPWLAGQVKSLAIFGGGGGRPRRPISSIPPMPRDALLALDSDDPRRKAA